MATKRTKDEDPSFEEAVQELESITRGLEGGSLSLEDSIKAYERGMELRTICLKLLEQAEKKLEIVERAHDGQPETRPMDGAPAERHDADLFRSRQQPDDAHEPPF